MNPSRSKLVLTLIAIFMASLLCPCLAASDNEPIQFRRGKDFQQSLDETIRLSSTATPLQSQLNELSRASRLAIYRDRRTNPQSLISVETDFTPRIQVLFRISETIPQTSVCIYENVVLIGPTPFVHRIPVLAELTENAVADVVRQSGRSGKTVKVKNIVPEWRHLAEPRQIFVEAATNAGLFISNPETIPHDLWAAGALPAMAFSDFAAILLNQFDLIAIADSKPATLKLQPLPVTDQVTHKYSLRETTRSDLEAKQKDLHPQLKTRWTSTTVELRGTLDEHSDLHSLIESNRYATQKISDAPSNRHPSIRKMSFQLKQGRMTATQLIESFQKNKLTIEVRDADSAAVRKQLDQIVEIEAMPKPVPSEKLFEMLFGDLFQVTIEDDRVVLQLKQQP